MDLAEPMDSGGRVGSVLILLAALILLFMIWPRNGGKK